MKTILLFIFFISTIFSNPIPSRPGSLVILLTPCSERDDDDKTYPFKGSRSVIFLETGYDFMTTFFHGMNGGNEKLPPHLVAVCFKQESGKTFFSSCNEYSVDVLISSCNKYLIPEVGINYKRLFYLKPTSNFSSYIGFGAGAHIGDQVAGPFYPNFSITLGEELYRRLSSPIRLEITFFPAMEMIFNPKTEAWQMQFRFGIGF